MKKILLFAIAMLCFGTAFAQTGKLSIEKKELQSGKEYEENAFVSIESNITDGRDIQFDLYVPNGMEIDMDYTDTDLANYKSGRTVVYEGKSCAVVTDKTMEGYTTYRILVFGMKAIPEKPMIQNGTIANIWFDTSKMTSGDVYPIYIKNIKMSKHGSSTEGYEFDDSQSAIGIDVDPTGIKDLNGDNANGNVVAYDLTGRKTTANAKGVKVINGKKVIK